MNGKDCRTVRLEIDSSEISQRLSEPVEAHLVACAACSQFRTERRELRELVGSLQPVAAPADFDMRLRARMARERESRARQPFIFRFAMTTPAIAVAALLVVVGSIVWMNQRNRTETSPAASAGRDKEQTNNTSPAPVIVKKDDNKTDPGVVATIDRRENQKHQTQSTRNVKAAPPASQVSDFSARRAESFPIRLDRDGEVSLTAPSKPMVVTVQDANGATHKISLPPISFGSQRFDNRTPVSMTNRRDW